MILIVDDNQENIFSLKTLLELNKFSVDTASSGEEALKCILKNSYSLILLDVQMPEMDGFEVAEAISGYNKSKDIPIIFLSAINTHKKFITRGYASGGVDYVTKPFDPDILLLKVKTLYRLSEQKRQLVEMDKILRAEIESRKKAENDLEQKVEELKSTLESMPQMAFTTGRDGAIEYVNNHWLSYSASTTEFPFTEGVSIGECMQIAISSGKQLVQEVKVRSLQDEAIRFHLLYLTPVVKGGAILRWVGIFTDIHEQKTASKMLEKKVEERTRELSNINKKLEASNVELQKFAFIASHDLQEPLRKIQIFSDIVVDKVKHDKEGATKFLNKIISSAERMRSLISSLLEYSRVPEKNMYEPVDLNLLVTEITQDLELEIKLKGASVVVNPLPTIEAISSQLRQVFQNLISNSLKFSRKSVAPEIIIAAELVRDKAIAAPAAEDGSFCRITLRDNGIGFDQQYGNKIFEIFQRLNQTERYKGTGIGLAIVKKVIERHDGIIVAQSSENKGATFIIILPVNQPAN